MPSKDNADRKLLMAGLPGSGKTTYLAAFWNLVEAGGVKGSLRLSDVLPPEREYLNSIRYQWLKFETLGRNPSIEINDAYMKLSTDEGDDTIEMYFPDVSGETYREIVEERVWGQEFGTLVRDITELLVLIHPNSICDMATIYERDRLSQRIEAPIDSSSPPGSTQPNLSDGTKESDGPTCIPWKPGLMSVEVKVIELVQLLTSAEASTSVQRICVVVSAWDLIEEFASTPSEWLRTNAPMLSQFLRANENRHSYRVFGVSAQGGDYSKPKDLERLRSLDRDTLKPQIFGTERDECEDHDITFPVRWLLKR